MGARVAQQRDVPGGQGLRPVETQPHVPAPGGGRNLRSQFQTAEYP